MRQGFEAPGFCFQSTEADTEEQREYDEENCLMEIREDFIKSVNKGGLLLDKLRQNNLLGSSLHQFLKEQIIVQVCWLKISESHFETFEHTRRVTALAEFLVDGFKKGEISLDVLSQVDSIQLDFLISAAAIHDIGKIDQKVRKIDIIKNLGWDQSRKIGTYCSSILQTVAFPGRLSDQMTKIIKLHPKIGLEWVVKLTEEHPNIISVEQISKLSYIFRTAFAHHEFDGKKNKRYPKETLEEVSLTSRLAFLLSIIDKLDAMICWRGYRLKGLGIKEAKNNLEKILDDLYTGEDSLIYHQNYPYQSAMQIIDYLEQGILKLKDKGCERLDENIQKLIFTLED